LRGARQLIHKQIIWGLTDGVDFFCHRTIAIPLAKQGATAFLTPEPEMNPPLPAGLRWIHYHKKLFIS